jgi:IPT/TIG domain
MRARSKKLRFAKSVVFIVLSWLCAAPAKFASDAAAQPGGSSSVASLESKVAKEPKNATLHYLLANEYVNQRNYPKAVLEYHICVELQPQSPAGKYSTQALVRLHKYDSGGPSLDEARAAANKILGSVGGGGTVLFAPNPNPDHQLQTPAPSVVSPTQAVYGPRIANINLVSSPPGQSLTISGTGFGVPRNELVVTINGQQAMVVSASSSSIECIIPEIDMPAWNAPVIVRTTYGVSNTCPLNIQPRIILRQ